MLSVISLCASSTTFRCCSITKFCFLVTCKRLKINTKKNTTNPKPAPLAMVITFCHLFLILSDLWKYSKALGTISLTSEKKRGAKLNPLRLTLLKNKMIFLKK
jgi:hypothetical protein